MNKPTNKELQKALENYQKHLDEFQDKLFELEEEINQAKAQQISQNLKDSKTESS
jgi:uncharacterized membrane protein (DUF106 family)